LTLPRTFDTFCLCAKAGVSRRSVPYSCPCKVIWRLFPPGSFLTCILFLMDDERGQQTFCNRITVSPSPSVPSFLGAVWIWSPYIPGGCFAGCALIPPPPAHGDSYLEAVPMNCLLPPGEYNRQFFPDETGLPIGYLSGWAVCGFLSPTSVTPPLDWFALHIVQPPLSSREGRF